jgi:hypothetical protein
VSNPPPDAAPEPEPFYSSVPGLRCVALPGATVRAVARLLAPDAPWVLIEQHFPHPTLEWVVGAVPLSDRSMRSPAARTVRHLEMDVLMSTAEFLEALPEFSQVGVSMGIRLWQLDRRTPARRFTDIPARSRAEVYRVFGVRLSVFLPHDGEPALVCSPYPSVIEDVGRRWVAA